MKKRNILYIDFNIQTLSNTKPLTPKLFSLIAKNIFFYGPGFNDKKTIIKGLENYINTIPKIDILVIGPEYPLLIYKEENLETYIRQLYFYLNKKYSLKVIREFIKDTFQIIKNIDVDLKLIQTISTDLYGCDPRQVNIIEENNLYLVGLNEQFIEQQKNFPDYTKNELHYIKKKSFISDCWFNYLSKNKDKVITALHFLSMEEFSYISFSDKRSQFVNPGSNYYLRKELIKVLDKNKFDINTKYFFYLYKFLNKCNIPVYRNQTFLNLYKYLYDRQIKSCKFITTARDFHGDPVRKFFEIPALGSLLLCVPPCNFNHIGYIPGQQYINLDPKNFEQSISDAMKNPNLDKIALRGREITEKNHTINARAIQIDICIEKILNHRYSRSYWEEGKFICESK